MDRYVRDSICHIMHVDEVVKTMQIVDTFVQVSKFLDDTEQWNTSL